MPFTLSSTCAGTLLGMVSDSQGKQAPTLVPSPLEQDLLELMIIGGTVKLGLGDPDLGQL